jgi:hypothetical protein
MKTLNLIVMLLAIFSAEVRAQLSPNNPFFVASALGKGAAVPATRPENSWPLTQSGLYFWGIAESLVKYDGKVNNDPVGLWYDERTNGVKEFFISSGTNRPIVKTGFNNTYAALEFNATNNTFLTASNSALFNAGDSFTMAFVAAPAPPDPNAAYNSQANFNGFFDSAPLTADVFRFRHASSAKNGVAELWDSSPTLQFTSLATNNVPRVYIITVKRIFDNPAYHRQIDSIEGYDITTTNLASSATGANSLSWINATIGNYNGGVPAYSGERFHGHLWELLFFSPACDEGQLSGLHSYLNGKYGLTVP